MRDAWNASADGEWTGVAGWWICTGSMETRKVGCGLVVYLLHDTQHRVSIIGYGKLSKTHKQGGVLKGGETGEAWPEKGQTGGEGPRCFSRMGWIWLEQWGEKGA